MARSKIAPALAACAAVLVLLGGCARTDVRTSVEDEPKTEVTEYVEEEQEPAFDAAAGPVLCVLNSGTFQPDSLAQVDPSTGEWTDVGSFSRSEAATTLSPLGTVHLGGWYFEQCFDPGLYLMAVNLEETSDGSQHVGFIDRNGNLTDVTSMLTPTKSDFAALPQHGNALFDSAGNFVYVDYATKELKRLDPVTMKPVGAAVNVANQYGNIPYAVILQPDGSVDTYQSDRLFDRAMVFDFILPNGNKITSFSESSIQDLVSADSVLVLWRELWGASAGTTLKIVSAGSVDGGDTENAEAIPAITPPTDWLIENASVSGDGSRVAFVASRGEERALFIMPVDGSSEPARVSDVPANARLLFWK